jgi:hypothetical protein
VSAAGIRPIILTSMALLAGERITRGLVAPLYVQVGLAAQ